MLGCRVLVGLGEGVAPTSATDLVARGCKQSERARATGFIFSGLHVGSLAGLLVAPYLIENFGWPSVSDKFHFWTQRKFTTDIKIDRDCGSSPLQIFSIVDCMIVSLSETTYCLYQYNLSTTNEKSRDRTSVLLRYKIYLDKGVYNIVHKNNERNGYDINLSPQTSLCRCAL